MLHTTIVNELLASNCNFKNVTPINEAKFRDIRNKLECAYTGEYKGYIYAVWTQEKPYKQYVLVMDMNAMKVIS